jgi:hypothetical protein
MLRYILAVLLIYLAYKLVFDFIVPVYRTTKRVRQQFQDIKNRMEEQNQSSTQDNSSNSEQKPEKVGEYIDFEEIKLK